jgi:heat shock protein HslJ
MSVIAFLFLIIFSNCTGNETKESSLYDTKWFLVKIHSGGATEEVTERKAYINFSKEKKNAGGNGSCNMFGGTLAVEGETMSITQIIATKMYCEGVQETENSFFIQLEKVNRFEIKNDNLFLYRDKEFLLEFEKERAIQK